MRMATVPSIPTFYLPSSTHRICPKPLLQALNSEKLSCKEASWAPEVTEICEAASKEYQGKLTAGLSKPSILKLAQKYDILKHI